MSDIGFMKAYSKNSHDYFHKTILMFPMRATSISVYKILLTTFSKRKTKFKKHIHDMFVKDIGKHHTISLPK